MIAGNKKKIDETLTKISDEYVGDVLEFLDKLESSRPYKSSMLLSEQSLAKEWLSKEEE